VKSSGRNNPCPVCNRTKDTDCRWNDDVILCHSGTDLTPGSTVNINGAEWAFIHHKGGFSGIAAVFKPHRELERGTGYGRTPNTAQDLLSRQTKRSQWADILEQFHNAFNNAWESPDFYNASPDELHAAFDVITDAQAKAAALRPHLQSIWREHPDLAQLHRLRIESQLKSIAYMAEDARQFQQNDLGIPCPAAVRAMAEEIS
jgi:hypothetical protein